MNTCKRLSASFSDFAENAMPPEQRRVLEAHLSGCSSCQAEIANLQNLRSSLRQLTRLHTPPDFEAILRARIRREGKRPVTPLVAMRWPNLVPRFAALALGGALLIAAMNLMLPSSPRGESNITSFDEVLPPQIQRTTSSVTQFTAPILYTLDRLSPKQWPMPSTPRGEPKAVRFDSLSVNPNELPHGPQNSRASLFSL